MKDTIRVLVAILSVIVFCTIENSEQLVIKYNK